MEEEQPRTQQELELLVAEQGAALRVADRALAVLGQCVDLLVSATDAPTLLRDVCRILVVSGGYRLAWVGFAEDDAERSVRPVAQAGYEDGYLDGVQISWGGGLRSEGPTGTAIRLGEPVVARHILADPKFAPWRSAAIERGYASSIAVPLMGDERALGALNIYSPEPDAFGEAEERLLVQLAEALSHGIGALRARREHARSQRDQRRLVAAIEATDNAVLITDSQGMIEYVNPAFERMSGYSREDVLGRSPAILRSGEHDAAFYEAMWRTLELGETWRGRFLNQRKDRRRYTVDSTISPVRAASGEARHYVCVQQDVSERIQIEEQLRQAAKMEAVGRLAAAVAHDFNNVLSVVQLGCQLLGSSLHRSDPLLQDVESIEEASIRGASLTRQLLLFSRKEGAAIEVLDLNATVLSMERMLRRLIHENVQLDLDLAAELAPMELDPSQLEQVVLNLVVNALDAMPSGGRLAVSTRMADVAAGGESSPPGRYLVLTVTDAGDGMDADTQARVFEPFFTTKERGRGTGLGLAIVFGIVEQGGGFIQIRSELGAGTTFEIFFPQTSKHREPAPAASAKVAESGHGEGILLVEDDSTIRAFTGRILTAAGYRVLEASGPGDALLLAEDPDLRIDLLFTDVIMPHLSGRDLASRLLPSRPSMRVLYMSGYPDDTLGHHGILDPGTTVLMKPFAASKLIDTVQVVLLGPPPEAGSAPRRRTGERGAERS